MRELIFNQYEQVVSDDLNNAQLAIQQSLYEYFLYNYFGQQSGVLGSSFIIARVDSTHVSHAAGIGFFYDSSKTGFDSKYRMIRALGSNNLAITAADATHNRIDVVWVKPAFTVIETASRYIKTGGTGPITLTSVDKGKLADSQFGITDGTPSASPAVPSLPSGAIALAHILVTAVTGIGVSGVSDARTILTFAVSNAGHTFLTGADLQSQLDEADARFLVGTTITAVSSNGVIASPNPYYLCDVSGGSITRTLPTAVGVSGYSVKVKNKSIGSANTVTVAPNGVENIEGANTSVVLAAGESATFTSDGAGWWV